MLAAIRLPKVQKSKGKTEALSESEIGHILESLESALFASNESLETKRSLQGLVSLLGL